MYNEADSFIVFGSLVAGLVFSLPALLLCLAFLPPLINSGKPLLEKIVVWCFIVVACIVVSEIFICLIFLDTSYIINNWLLIVPGLTAAVISILIRIPQFENLIGYKSE